MPAEPQRNAPPVRLSFGTIEITVNTLRILLALATLLTTLTRVWAQPLAAPSAAVAPSTAPSVSEILTDLKSTTPKAVFLVLDVSDSMKQKDLSGQMYEVVRRVLNDSLSEGDRVALFTFGPSYTKVFDEVPTTPAARRKLLELIPRKPQPGEGTNIRQPHHEVLKLAKEYADQTHGTPIVVLMTDSFNDPPKSDPAAYDNYKKYYTPGKIAVFPNTPENTDYESLLRWVKTHGKTYGIGVGIEPSQRPLERFSVALKTEEEATPEPTPTPAAVTPVSEKSEPPYVLIIGIGVVGLGAVLAATRGASKPMPLRVSGGPAGGRDFDVRGSAVLKLGGEGGSASLDSYPLPQTKEVTAVIRGSRGQFMVQPQPNIAARVFVNGMPLEKPTPLRYGDEIRISIPEGSGGPGRDVRLKFSDPTKSF